MQQHICLLSPPPSSDFLPLSRPPTSHDTLSPGSQPSSRRRRKRKSSHGDSRKAAQHSASAYTPPTSPVKIGGDTPTNPDPSPMCSSPEPVETTPTNADAVSTGSGDGARRLVNGVSSSKDAPATPKSDPGRNKSEEARFQVVRGKPRRLSRKFGAASEATSETASANSSAKTAPACNGFHPSVQTAPETLRAVSALCDENHPPQKQPSSVQLRKVESTGQRVPAHKSPSPPPPVLPPPPHTTATKTAWHKTPTR